MFVLDLCYTAQYILSVSSFCKMMSSNIFVCLLLILANSCLSFAIVGNNPTYDSDDDFGSYVTGDWEYDDDDEYVYEIDEGDNRTFYRCPGEHLEVRIYGLCDGFADCVDQSDEDPQVCQRYENETTATVPNEIGKFSGEVSPTKLSNTFDYLDMRCSEDEFECPSEPGLCVPAEVICDGHGDCPEGNDELYCANTDPSTSSANLDADSALGDSASTARGGHYHEGDTNFRETHGMMERLSGHRRHQRPRNNLSGRHRYRPRENYSHSPGTFHYFPRETLDNEPTMRPTLAFRTTPPVIQKLDPHSTDQRIGEYQTVLRHEASEIDSGDAADSVRGDFGKSVSSDPMRLNQMTDAEAERFLKSQNGRLQKRKKTNKKSKLSRLNANKGATPNAETSILSNSQVNSVRSHKKKFQGLIGKLMNQVGKALISNSKIDNRDININISIRNSNRNINNNNRNSIQQTQHNSKRMLPKITLQLEMDL